MIDCPLKEIIGQGRRLNGCADFLKPLLPDMPWHRLTPLQCFLQARDGFLIEGTFMGPGPFRQPHMQGLGHIL